MVNKELKKNSKIRTVNMMIQSALIIILIVLVVNMMVEIKNLQGTARVINYAGLVRGATQRAVKLEVIGNSDDELIEYLDNVLADLKYEDGKYNLVSLRDTDYQKKLDIQIDYWGKLKNEINNIRENGVDNSDIVDMSEMYFSLADQTVSAAERYSEGIADNIHFIETITVIDMAGLLLLIITQMIQAIIIVRKNKVLEQKAYLDAHTGLPNKSRCEEVFHDLRFLDRNVACIMFDLNNLKIANDTLGHSVGDQLIVNFANILRNVIPSKEFVGRYGGDEFVAVIRDMPKEDVIGLLEKLKEEVDDFNDHGKNIKISYAYGWAFSDDYTECTLRTLFDRADKHMYENKRLVKLAQQ
jgi:diguanylate cyclase (GGDEF)-like protein